MSSVLKGLAALLVEGLSGATPVEILKVSPAFMEKLGLQQSLTPSRSNGFFNMLRLMQKKTMQAYMGTSTEPEVVETKSNDAFRRTLVGCALYRQDRYFTMTSMRI